MIKGELNKSIKSTKAFQEYQEPKTKISMKLEKKQKELIFELIDIEIERLQSEIDKWGKHKYWSDKIKEYREIKKIIKQR